MKKKIRILFPVIIILIIGYVVLRSGNSHKIEQSNDWNLIVVNRWNKAPEEHSVTLKTLSNGQQIDTRIYPALQEMFDAARTDGVFPIVRRGYRSEQEQQELFDEEVQGYIAEGYSERKAKKLAMEWVALPGTSEHQLGIAVDINADSERSDNNKVYEWLAENAHTYGFILRYPRGKESITGTQYEPWHYRYVGKQAAAEIHVRGICLEEYLQ